MGFVVLTISFANAKLSAPLKSGSTYKHISKVLLKQLFSKLSDRHVLVIVDAVVKVRYFEKNRLDVTKHQ